MGRYNIADLDKFPQEGGGSYEYFQLKDDKDTAKVRVLYDSAEDIQFFVVHEVKENGKSRFVNCLEDDNTSCPLCEAGYKKVIKLVVPLYDITEKKVKLWTRPRSFAAKLQGLCARYAEDFPLYCQPFDVERCGAAGYNKTTYEFYPLRMSSDDEKITMEDFGDVPDPLGTAIWDKSEQDMKTFLLTGSFPSSGGSNIDINGPSEDVPPRRRGRRTPSNGENNF